MNKRKHKEQSLSTYVKKQLSTLLKKVYEQDKNKFTPKKKSYSLQKIQSLIQRAPTQQISKTERKEIVSEIKRVQSAIQTSSRIHKKVQSQKKSIGSLLNFNNLATNRNISSRNSSKLVTNTNRHRELKIDKKESYDPYVKNLFFQKLLLQQKQLNLQNKKNNHFQSKQNQPSKTFISLVEKFQELRIKRLQHQQYLQTLTLKAQKLERLISIRKENQQKYLQSLNLAEVYDIKKQSIQKIKREVRTAAQQNRKKMVSVLMKKYNNELQLQVSSTFKKEKEKDIEKKLKI